MGSHPPRYSFGAVIWVILAGGVKVGPQPSCPVIRSVGWSVSWGGEDFLCFFFVFWAGCFLGLKERSNKGVTKQSDVGFFCLMFLFFRSSRVFIFICFFEPLASSQHFDVNQ